MDLEKIKKNLKTRALGRKINFESSVDSTNAWALRTPGDWGEIFLTDFQTAGRGRQTRTWESPAGKNILLSIRDAIPALPEKPFQLSLVAGVAFLEGLAKIAPTISFRLKWPNDILISEKKLGGILSETREEAAVIGVGLNINAGPADFSPGVSPLATSLKIASEKDWSREEIIAACLNAYEVWQDKFRKEGIKPIIAAWNERTDLVGKKVTVHEGISPYSGTVEGLDDEGFLIVNVNGKKRTMISGDLALTQFQPGTTSSGL